MSGHNRSSDSRSSVPAISNVASVDEGSIAVLVRSPSCWGAVVRVDLWAVAGTVAIPTVAISTVALSAVAISAVSVSAVAVSAVAVATLAAVVARRIA